MKLFRWEVLENGDVWGKGRNFYNREFEGRIPSDTIAKVDVGDFNEARIFLGVPALILAVGLVLVAAFW